MDYEADHFEEASRKLREDAELLKTLADKYRDRRSYRFRLGVCLPLAGDAFGG